MLCLGGYQRGKVGLLLKVEGFHKVLLRVNRVTPALKGTQDTATSSMLLTLILSLVGQGNNH